MPNDPQPIEPGSLGTVTQVQNLGIIGSREETMLYVDWDSGRSLNVILPIDTIEKVLP